MHRNRHLLPGLRRIASVLADAASLGLLIGFLLLLWAALPGGEAMAAPAAREVAPFAFAAPLVAVPALIAFAGLRRKTLPRAAYALREATAVLFDFRRFLTDAQTGQLLFLIGCVGALAALALRTM